MLDRHAPAEDIQSFHHSLGIIILAVGAAVVGRRGSWGGCSLQPTSSKASRNTEISVVHRKAITGEFSPTNACFSSVTNSPALKQLLIKPQNFGCQRRHGNISGNFRMHFPALHQAQGRLVPPASPMACAVRRSIPAAPAGLIVRTERLGIPSSADAITAGRSERLAQHQPNASVPICG